MGFSLQCKPLSYPHEVGEKRIVLFKQKKLSKTIYLHDFIRTISERFLLLIVCLLLSVLNRCVSVNKTYARN